MKLKIVAIIVLSLFSNKIISQAIENVNPKGKWYFGAEIGPNIITSFEVEGNKTSFQVGFLTEYYFARHWSLSARIKAFDTGVSFYTPEGDGWLSPIERKGTFKGSVIAIPIDIKWEFRIHKNLGASLKGGIAFTQETKSDYSNYSDYISTDFAEQYLAFNFGIGLNYFINKETAVYIDFEHYSGEAKSDMGGIFEGGKDYYRPENTLINFGIKYHFNKDPNTK